MRELLLRHVPDRYEHLVRYVGWYSNRARGERAKDRNDRDAPNPCAASAETVSEFAQHARAAWTRLIRKVYEAAGPETHCLGQRALRVGRSRAHTMPSTRPKAPRRTALRTRIRPNTANEPD